MKKQSTTTWVMMVVVLCFGLPKARAGIIIQDQSDGSGWQILHYSPTGQTFTAEDAHILSIGFSLWDCNPSAGPIDITVELFEGVGTIGQSLGSAPIAGLSPGFDGFYDADFSLVTLTVGQVYTAIVSSTSARGAVRAFQWAFPDGTPLAPDPYTGGDCILWGNVQEFRDSTFRVIPEPATLLLLGLGCLALRRKLRAK